MPNPPQHDEQILAELKRLDPRGLIDDAYKIDGAGPEACRSIFLDWALGRSEAEGAPESLRRLHEIHAPMHPGHPMTEVLAEGLARPRPERGRRTGGSGARYRS